MLESFDVANDSDKQGNLVLFIFFMLIGVLTVKSLFLNGNHLNKQIMER